MDVVELEQLIANSLLEFYRRRLQKAQQLKLKQVLRRKNPYLLRALGIERASEIVERLLEHQLSASDETIFGDAFFEPIALIVSGGTVSPTEGVDFSVETDTKYLAVAVKSGPNVFNASQKRRQATEFNALRSRLQKIQKQYDPLLGHAYGRYDSGPAGGKTYRDSSGQAFWEDITGDPDFYLRLITLMREEPQKHKAEFRIAWDAVTNKFIKEFTVEFCLEDGRIDWEGLVEFVSARPVANSRSLQG